MKTQKIYIAHSVDKLPDVANDNYLTVSEKGYENLRFFNGTRFEHAHYEGEITHWLEPKEDMVVMTEQRMFNCHVDFAKKLLCQISKTFLEGVSKADNVSDSQVFLAIGQTMQNFPMPTYEEYLKEKAK